MPRRGTRVALPEAGSAEKRPGKSGRRERVGFGGECSNPQRKRCGGSSRGGASGSGSGGMLQLSACGSTPARCAGRERVGFGGNAPTPRGAPAASCRATAGGTPPAGKTRPASPRARHPRPRRCRKRRFRDWKRGFRARKAGIRPCRPRQPVPRERRAARARARGLREKSRGARHRAQPRARGPPAGQRQAGAVPRGAAARAADLRGGLPRHRGEGAPRRGRRARGRAVLRCRAARSGEGVSGQVRQRPAARAARLVGAGDPRPGPREKDATAGCRRARRGVGRAVPDVRAVRRRDGRAAGRGRRHRPKGVVLPADPPRPAAPIRAPPGARAGNPNPHRGESCQGGGGHGGGGRAYFCATRRRPRGIGGTRSAGANADHWGRPRARGRRAHGPAPAGGVLVPRAGPGPAWHPEARPRAGRLGPRRSGGRAMQPRGGGRRDRRGAGTPSAARCIGCRVSREVGRAARRHLAGCPLPRWTSWHRPWWPAYR